jgi:hypothetical protein
MAFPETVRKNPKVSDIPTSMSKPEVWISWILVANRWKISSNVFQLCAWSKAAAYHAISTGASSSGKIFLW